MKKLEEIMATRAGVEAERKRLQRLVESEDLRLLEYIKANPECMRSGYLVIKEGRLHYNVKGCISVRIEKELAKELKQLGIKTQ